MLRALKARSPRRIMALRAGLKTLGFQDWEITQAMINLLNGGSSWWVEITYDKEGACLKLIES